jgi:hypothetical protein
LQANAGDSRSVLGVKGRAKPLSFDHKPQNEGISLPTSGLPLAKIFIGEKARITAAGGFVDFGRVNGNLALSRAIGDFEFKKSADLSPEQQIVTAFPDVVTHEVTNDDEFLVIACDGEPCSHTIDFPRVPDSFFRHLGLPVLPSRRRIRAKRYCGEARSASHLREYDGQLLVFE